MPILENFTIPTSVESLKTPSDHGSTFFIAFLASKDPVTKQPWCPDVVAALPTLQRLFSGKTAPEAAFVDVGQRPEFKDPKNFYRTNWNINKVPTLVRYERSEKGVNEVGRLVEHEILAEEQLQQLVHKSAI